MKTTLTTDLTWYPLEPHVGQNRFSRCLIRNGSAETITISQRGGSSPGPDPGVAADNMGFPLAPGTEVIVPTQEKLWAACAVAAQVLTYEYLA